MSTVGYGDILPHSIGEGAYVICAVILDCGYLGFVLGSMASIISCIDTADPEVLPPALAQEVHARRGGHHE